MVNKISWQKAGRITEPGRYMFTFGWLTVTADDLAIWQRHPDALFTLVELPPPAQRASDEGDEDDEQETSEYHLGTFELPSESGRN